MTMEFKGEGPMRKFNQAIQGIQKTQVALILFFTGLVIGILCANFARSAYMMDLKVVNRAYYEIMDNTKIDQVELLRYTLISNARQFLIYWVLCITILGLPYIVFSVAYKGFEIGFFLSALTLLYGAKGIILFFACQLPQALIYVPVMLLSLKKGYELTQQITANSKNHLKFQRKMMMEYLAVMAILFVFLAIGSIVETYFGLLVVKKTMGFCL